MDWNIILSSAIGTLAGTILSVLVAWWIYHSEKNDSLKKKKQEYTNRVAEECIELINDVIINTFQFERYMSKPYNEKARFEKLHEKYFEFVNDFQSNTEKLRITGTILYNLYELDKFSDLELFLEKNKELINSTREIEDHYEMQNKINNKVDEVKDLGGQIILEIQEEILKNIDSNLIDNNIEKAKDTDK